MGKYTNDQGNMEFNPEFWKEVLVGRTIKEIVHTEKGLTGFKLDNDELISLVPTSEGGKTLGVLVE